MAKQDTGRVVVRRKRAYGESHHGGSWKIAYADFMTAMMAFFLVMWLLLLIPKTELQGIAEYFRMPLMTAVTGGPNLDTSKSAIPGGQPSVIPNTSPKPPAATPDQNADDLADLENLENLKQQLENLIENNPVLKQFRPQLLLDMTPDGLRIQILDQQNRPMFATGSARVQPYMRDILRELAPPINQLPNSISLSGHTDAMQYASGDRSYSNWELSADRANAARRELVAGGLVEKKVKRILGLSDTVNLIEDDPMAAVNRRISILVLNRSAERRIDRQNTAGASGARIRAMLEELSHPSTNGSQPSGAGSQPGVATEPATQAPAVVPGNVAPPAASAASVGTDNAPSQPGADAPGLSQPSGQPAATSAPAASQ
ncbi:flagellar motor protein MotB [Castellaniella sp.]|uniref:flagellar motor protein MotB n=1 Tax=Castellaniella sp. TaxID=1955812 RepID=UPI003C779F3A